MNRTWFLSNTCYGQWLPGDARGFVGHVWEHRDGDDENDIRIVHDLLGTDYDGDIPHLEATVRSLMIGPPISLTLEHALVALTQFLETAKHRNWSILAAAIMFNHFHLVVEVLNDPAPGKILGDFKSWGTRALTKQFGAPLSKTWWTERGSKRILKDEAAVRAVCNYVLIKQPNPFIVWSPGSGAVIEASGAA